MLPFTWLPKVHTRERTYECSRWVKDFSQSTLIGTVKYYYVFMGFFLFIVLKYTYIKFAILSILVYSLVLLISTFTFCAMNIQDFLHLA